MRSPDVGELAAALAKAQGSMRNATLNRTNPHFKSRYADLASVFDAIRKPLADNGLAVSQLIDDGRLVTLLMHSGSGEWLSSEMTLPTAAKPQELGSALTYYRRYTLTSLLGIGADDDDDANGAQKATLSTDDFSEKISTDQVHELQALLNIIGRTDSEYCQYKKINSLANIKVGQFQSIKNELEGWASK